MGSDDDFIVMQIRVKGLIGALGELVITFPVQLGIWVTNAFELIDFLNRIEDVLLVLFGKSCQ